MPGKTKRSGDLATTLAARHATAFLAAWRNALSTARTACAACAALAGVSYLPPAAAAPLTFASPPAEIAKAVLDDEPGTVAVGIWRNQQGRFALQRNPVGSVGEVVEGDSAAAQPFFEIGSISKVFTGLLLAQAVERGDLSLDDTLGKLLEAKATLKPETAAITLRQLVTHSACLPREPQDFPGYGTPNPFSRHDRWKIYAGLSGMTLEHAPPCGAAYSNLGMGLVGQLLSDHYAKPWDVLVRENITGPLGMRDTMQYLGRQASRLATGYQHEALQAPWDFDALSGAGALRSTAPDLLLLARALMAGRAGPLGPAAERALTPLGRFRGDEIGYAILIRGPAGHRTYHHDGLTGGYRTLLAFAPDTQEAVAILASNSHANPVKVLTGITASRYPIAPAAQMAPAPAALAEYGGVYQADKDTSFTFVAQDGKLYRRSTGTGFRALSPGGPDTFVDADAGARYVFSREAGEIVRVDYYLGDSGFSGFSGFSGVAGLRTKEAVPPVAVVPLDKQLDYAGHYRARRFIRTDLDLDVRAENGQLGVRAGNWFRRPVFPVAGKPDRFAYENGRSQLQFERDAAGHVAGAVLYENGVIRLRRLP